jgi:hypothetical protein
MNTEKFLEEVKEAFIKAIGTSSSINEERDERSVENYVRTGGNTMENTTEPDPKGDIAVTKSFPTPNAGDLVNQTTRPEGDVSVSDAPNNPGVVPNQETMPSSATSAIAPSKTDEVNTPDNVVVKASAGKCEACGQSLPVEKADEPKDADELTKSSTCADCGKSMDLCDCMGKAVDSESKETPSDEARETKDEEAAEAKAGTEKPMKKSLWGGAFAPVK